MKSSKQPKLGVLMNYFVAVIVHLLIAWTGAEAHDSEFEVGSSQLINPASGGATFQGLGDLPGGYYSSQAHAISADGSTVVGRSTGGAPGAVYEAFRWTAATGMVGLGFLPPGNLGLYSDALAVSADGSVVVGFGSSPTGQQAFRWTAGGMVGLGYLPGGALLSSKATTVSADGSVVMGEASTTVLEAFRWTAGTGMVSLDTPTVWPVIGGSADGSVAVGTIATQSEAYRWTPLSGVVTLGFLSGDSMSITHAVSADGMVVVGRATYEAFRWNSGTGMVGLGHLPGGILGYASAASSDGSVIVGADYISPTYVAFIWDTENGMRNLEDVLVDEYGLDLTGWTLRNPTGVSADGLTIVGTGTNPEGLMEGWIATMPAILPPFAVCEDVTVDADADCLGEVTGAMVNAGSTVDQNCESAAFSLDPPGPYSLGETVVTLTVADQCDQSDSCTATVTLVDNSPPQISCPPNVTVECVAHIPAADFSSGNASDNCDTDPAVVHRGDTDNGGAGCLATPLIIIRTYEATDGGGNSAECTQTITVADMTAPEITCPLDETVTCGEAMAPDALGSATATDNCDPAPVISHMDSISEPVCLADPVDFVITRTWTAIDFCGNASSCDQIITVLKVVLPSDIKPQSCPNPIGLSSQGVIPTAVLGSVDFDVNSIVLATVRLSRADCVGSSVAPHEGPPGPHSVYDDVGNPPVGELCECDETTPDGMTDLLMKFKTAEVVSRLGLGALPPGDLVELVVTGELDDGCEFISADCVWLVPPGDSPD